MRKIAILLLLTACHQQPDPVVKVDCSKEPSVAETAITALLVMRGASFYPTECIENGK